MSSYITLNTSTVSRNNLSISSAQPADSEQISTDISREKVQNLRNDILKDNTKQDEATFLLNQFTKDMDKALEMSFKAKKEAVEVLADKLKEAVPSINQDNVDTVLSYLTSLATSLTAKEREERGIEAKHTVGAANIEMKAYASVTNDNELMVNLLDEERKADEADQVELEKYKRLEGKGFALSADTDLSKISDADINKLDQGPNKTNEPSVASAKNKIQKSL